MTRIYTPSDTNHATAVEFDDGDAPSAANINALAEAAFNTARYAAKRVGAYHTITMTQGTSSDIYGSLGSTTAATWGTGNLSIGSLNVQAGDQIDVQVHLQGKCSAAAQASYRLAYQYAGDPAPTGIARTVRVFESTLGNVTPFSMGCEFGAPSTGVIEFFIQMQVGGGATLEVYGPISPSLRSERVVI